MEGVISKALRVADANDGGRNDKKCVALGGWPVAPRGDRVFVILNLTPPREGGYCKYKVYYINIYKAHRTSLIDVRCAMWFWVILGSANLKTPAVHGF